MLLSKTFGYALRGILFIALMQDENRKVQLNEISGKLSVPKYYLGKIMQQMVKAGMLQSVKGPSGGFFLAANTLNTSLLQLAEITDGMKNFNTCVLQMKNCNPINPCPLHRDIEEIKAKILYVFTYTKIGDLLYQNKGEFIRGLSILKNGLV